MLLMAEKEANASNPKIVMVYVARLFFKIQKV